MTLGASVPSLAHAIMPCSHVGMTSLLHCPFQAELQHETTPFLFGLHTPGHVDH